MQKDIELLLKMQEIDYFIGELERSKDYIPDMIENLKREIEECFQASENYSERLTEAKKEMRSIELEVQSTREALDKYQQQMLTIKTNKEYDALVKEIDECKETISSGEDRGIDQAALPVSLDSPSGSTARPVNSGLLFTRKLL